MALDQDAIEDAIEENLQQPKRVKFGSREVEQHSLKDQKALLDSVANDDAATTNAFGLRFTRLIPGPSQ